MRDWWTVRTGGLVLAGGGEMEGNKPVFLGHQFCVTRSRLQEPREKRAGVCLGFWWTEDVEWGGRSGTQPSAAWRLGAHRSHHVHLPTFCCLEYCPKHGTGAIGEPPGLVQSSSEETKEAPHFPQVEEAPPLVTDAVS